MPSQVKHSVRWEVEQPFTCYELAEIQATCSDALIPESATLRIIHWQGNQGYTVEATWS